MLQQRSEVDGRTRRDVGGGVGSSKQQQLIAEGIGGLRTEFDEASRISVPGSARVWLADGSGQGNPSNTKSDG